MNKCEECGSNEWVEEENDGTVWAHICKKCGFVVYVDLNEVNN